MKIGMLTLGRGVGVNGICITKSTRMFFFAQSTADLLIFDDFRHRVNFSCSDMKSGLGMIGLEGFDIGIRALARTPAPVKTF